MKILISGHTNGIGASIAKYFANKNYQVTGYSRSNNRDLSHALMREQFSVESLLNDIVVINANIGFDSTSLFYKVCQICKGKTDKTIIVLGSQTTETTKTFAHPYQIHKLALESAAQQLQNIPGYPTIVVVRPGYVDTPSVQSITNVRKMSPDSVAEVIWSIVELNKSKDYKILNILFAPK
jgi:NAD(P)-dependent dehydrogenase (short-subunit alcohol dehydrogenase family)